MSGLGIYESLHMLHRAWRYRNRTERDEVRFMLAQDLKDKLNDFEPPPIPDLPTVQAGLDRTEAILRTRREEVLEYHLHVEQFVDEYNGAIEALSTQLLQWNQRLTQWEAAHQ